MAEEKPWVPRRCPARGLLGLHGSRDGMEAPYTDQHIQLPAPLPGRMFARPSWMG